MNKEGLSSSTDMIVESAPKSSPKKMNTSVPTKGEILSISSVSRLYTRRALATGIDCTAILLLAVALYSVAYFKFQNDYVMVLLVSWIPLALYPLLGAWFESSAVQGTPGKRALGLVVCDENGKKLSFARSLGRNLAKGISVIAFSVPITLILFSNRFQTIHDRISKAYVTSKDFSGSPKLADTNSQTEIATQANPVGNRIICTAAGGNLECAPIISRIAAAFWDGIIFYSIEMAGSIFLLSILLDMVGPTVLRSSTFDSLIGLSGLAFFVVFISTMLVVVLMAVLESSKLQATPGKIICGLKTTTLRGEKISLKEALFKQFIQGMIYLCMFPTIWTPGIMLMLILKHYNLPAEIVPLIAYFTFYLAYGTLLCATLFKSNQSIVDRLSNRFVVVDNPRRGPIEIA